MSERSLIEAGYRRDVYAQFPCNTVGVRVGTYKTLHGAAKFAVKFSQLNKVKTWLKLRHDPLLDEVMNRKSGAVTCR